MRPVIRKTMFITMALALGCSSLHQTPIDPQHDIFLFNETRTACPLLIYMDGTFATALPFSCPNCAILDVAAGIHELDAYRDLDGQPGTLVASTTIVMDGYKDWWWRIRSCPED